jgi:hypothetical protein
MRGRYWIRVVLCGSIAGVVWYLLSAVLLALFAQDLLAAVQKAAPYPRWDGASLLAIDLMMGIWAMWLYSAIAPQYGAKPGTAMIAGVAWWIMKTLQSAKWAGLGLIPLRVILVPLATTLVAVLLASLLGAWLYERVDRPPAKDLVAT